MILLRGHPNIVKLYGFFEDSSYSYLVLELVPGGRLFDFIKSRQSPKYILLALISIKINTTFL